MKWSDIEYDNFYIPYDENRKTICGFLLTTLNIDLEMIPYNFFESFKYIESKKSYNDKYEYKKVFLNDIIGTSYKDYSTDDKIIYSFIKLQRVCRYIKNYSVTKEKYFKLLRKKEQDIWVELSTNNSGKYYVDGNGNHRIILYKILMLSEIANNYPYVYEDDYNLNFRGFEEISKKYWLYAKVRIEKNKEESSNETKI